MLNSQRVHGPWSVGRIYQTISRNHGYVSKNGTLMLDWFLEIKHAGPYVYIYMYILILYIYVNIIYIYIYTHLFLLESHKCFSVLAKKGLNPQLLVSLESLTLELSILNLWDFSPAVKPSPGIWRWINTLW